MKGNEDWVILPGFRGYRNRLGYVGRSDFPISAACFYRTVKQ